MLINNFPNGLGRAWISVGSDPHVGADVQCPVGMGVCIYGRDCHRTRAKAPTTLSELQPSSLFMKSELLNLGARIKD